ncbi:MAG: hypothetical protein R2836_09990 [Chitinophagales bacterium]|nr:hypothetical protein [Chitinophagales bacterium]
MRNLIYTVLLLFFGIFYSNLSAQTFKSPEEKILYNVKNNIDRYEGVYRKYEISFEHNVDEEKMSNEEMEAYIKANFPEGTTMQKYSSKEDKIILIILFPAALNIFEYKNTIYSLKTNAVSFKFIEYTI